MNTCERLPRMFKEIHPLTPFKENDLWQNICTPWKIFSDLGRSQTNLNNECLPKIAVHSDEKQYCIEAELPGMAKEDIHLEMNNGYLTLQGERHESCEHHEEDGYWLHERHFGSFSRSIRLPEDAQTEQITASHKDGLLSIVIPRQAKAQAKAIPVQEA